HAALDGYQKYAMVGDPEAMARLGRLYLDGKSIERNEALGHSLLKRAAARGNALARKALADEIDATTTPDS
ncbi:MAG: SEL1-like repeat protein, partial [Pseudomonadales bacterium]|nr:SEL1-like repeat protein [Pseudomonadales bacterium]